VLSVHSGQAPFAEARYRHKLVLYPGYARMPSLPMPSGLISSTPSDFGRHHTVDMLVAIAFRTSKHGFINGGGVELNLLILPMVVAMVLVGPVLTASSTSCDCSGADEFNDRPQPFAPLSCGRSPATLSYAAGGPPVLPLATFPRYLVAPADPVARE
jgi:hypothetical protein